MECYCTWKIANFLSITKNCWTSIYLASRLFIFFFLSMNKLPNPLIEFERTIRESFDYELIFFFFCFCQLIYFYFLFSIQIIDFFLRVFIFLEI
jgi:hypothetical protein